MMTKQLNPDKIAEQYRLYKQAREARIAQEQQLIQQQAEGFSFWQAKKEISGKQVTCRKSHVCVECGRVIEAGETATVKAHFTNLSSGGYTAGFQTTYTCIHCKPKKEA
jgi:hypothetical protein